MSGGNTERAFDEPHLAEGIGLRQPADLSLPDDVHCFVSRNFVSRNGVQRAIDGSETLTGDHALFSEAVILLQNVVHVRRPATLATTPQLFGLLQFRHGRRVRRVPSHIDDARVNVPGLLDRKLEKAFGCNGIAISREQEVDRVASRIDGLVEVRPLPGYPDVRLIAALRAVWIPHL